MKDIYFKGKNKNELLSDLGNTAQVGSEVYELQRTAITVRCTEDIEKSINNLNDTIKNNSVSNDKLSSKVFWLNVIITAATVIGTIFGVIAFFIR